MAVLLQLIIFGIIILIGFQFWNMLKGRETIEARDRGVIDGTAREISSPGKNVAQSLKDFENARAELRGRYPSVFAMLGGYLNSHSLSQAGSLEGAVAEMIADWKSKSDDVSRELTKILAENETEEECRAIVLAACDADLEREGYRAWMTWLLGQFNEFNH